MKFKGLAVLAGLGILASLALVFGYVPPEKTMGIVYKIFYFHVPNAIAMGSMRRITKLRTSAVVFEGS